jgi:hypothetical protein
MDALNADPAAREALIRQRLEDIFQEIYGDPAEAEGARRGQEERRPFATFCRLALVH